MFVYGDKALIDKLQTLKKTTAKAAIRKGTREGAKIVKDKVRDLTPVLTGMLRSQIKVRSLPRSRVWTGTDIMIVESNKAFKAPKRISEKAKTKLAYRAKRGWGLAFYGPFVELGTKHIEARHFMKRASDAVGERAMKRAIDVIIQTIGGQ